MKNTVHYTQTIERPARRKHQLKPSLRTRRNTPVSAQRSAILRMYQDQQNTINEIAERFGISNGSVTNVAKRAGLGLRRQGCRARTSPPPGIQEILLEAWIDSYQRVAKRFGLSKQRVGQIVKRWKDWASAHLGERVLNKTGKKQVSPKPRRVASPHVVSFRVPNTVFALLVAQSRGRQANSSPHEAARSFLIEHINTLPNQVSNH